MSSSEGSTMRGMRGVLLDQDCSHAAPVRGAQPAGRERARSPAPAGPPNIVFILADDLGWTDLGCQGVEILRDAEHRPAGGGGMRSPDGYTCGPNCQPTRAALMSGQYGPRTGVYTVGSIDRSTGRIAAARPVDNASSCRSKGHCRRGPEEGGLRHGHVRQVAPGRDADYQPIPARLRRAIVSDGPALRFPHQPQVKVPRTPTSPTSSPTRPCASSSGTRTGRSFSTCRTSASMSPHQAKTELIASFKDKPGRRAPRPDLRRDDRQRRRERRPRADKARRIEARRNTLVIFSTDNGGVGGYQAAGMHARKAITDNAPLRGGKGMLYEGGIRVPLSFAGRDRQAWEAYATSRSSSVDLYPTLLELAGGSAPPVIRSTAVSFVAVLQSAGEAKLDRDGDLLALPRLPRAARTRPGGRRPPAQSGAGDWKLLEFFEDGRVELYNLKDDVGETETSRGDAGKGEGAARQAESVAAGHPGAHAVAQPRVSTCFGTKPVTTYTSLIRGITMLFVRFYWTAARCAVAVLILAMQAGVSSGQIVSGSIVGTVADASGGTIPGVKVTATNEETNLTRETLSNDAGYFAIPSLPPGRYRVAASQPGFKSAKFPESSC